MNHPRLLHATFVLAFAGLCTGFSASLPAQRLTLPNDGGRTLQLFDLRRVRHDGDALRTALTAAPCRASAHLLRQFVEPPLGPGDDLTALGTHWLAMLADAERIASLDRLMQAMKKHRNDLLTTTIRIVAVPDAAFRQQLAERLVKVEADDAETYEQVVAKDSADDFLRRLAQATEHELAAPTLTVRPLQPANLEIGSETSYVRDYVVRRDGKAVIPDPVIDKVWDGLRANLCATFLPDGRIGVDWRVQVQTLHRPIARVETAIAPEVQPLAVQLPHTSAVEVATTTDVGPGDLIALAARRPAGGFVVAVLGMRRTAGR